MSCLNYYCNSIALDPDNAKVTLSATSPSGWYVLYRPDSSPSAVTSAPLPIYHTQGSATYAGWTTDTPINCQGGNQNYPAGRCDLLYMRIEESPQVYGGVKEPITIEKDALTVTGRFIRPKVPNRQNDEIYCFYNENTLLPSSKIATTIVDNQYFQDNNWFLGTIIYRMVPSAVLVADKTFGAPLTAFLRGVGLYSSLLLSLEPATINFDNTNQPPIVSPGVSLPVTISFNPINQQITITDHPPFASVALSTDTLGNGTITSSNAPNVDWSGKSLSIPLGSAQSTVISLVGVNFASYPVSLTVSSGNISQNFTI